MKHAIIAVTVSAALTFGAGPVLAGGKGKSLAIGQDPLLLAITQCGNNGAGNGGERFNVNNGRCFKNVGDGALPAEDRIFGAGSVEADPGAGASATDANTPPAE